MSSARQRVERLRELLEQANYAYFVETQPIMPDSEFDRLMENLRPFTEAAGRGLAKAEQPVTV